MFNYINYIRKEKYTILQWTYSYSYSYFIEFTHQTCMKKVHDNVHKRYSDKTMLTIETNLLKIEQAPVNTGTFIGTGGTLG